jgi:MerR family transcriptional regulator, redox-sensitive transcriptional activator SoxR
MRRAAELTIGEAARHSGVSSSTLRYWEGLGLLDAPERVGGKRRYDARTLQRISLIVLVKRAGFTLAETGIVLDGLSERTPPPEIWRELAERKLPEIKRTLAEARAMKRILEDGLRCDCMSLDQCLDQIDHKRIRPQREKRRSASERAGDGRVHRR